MMNMSSLSVFNDPSTSTAVVPSAEEVVKEYFSHKICPLTYGDGPLANVDDDGGPVSWTDDQMEILCQEYLAQNLAILQRPGNGLEKFNVLCWIADDEVDGGLSFQAVCATGGFDPDVIRNRLKHYLKQINFRFTASIDSFNRIRLGLYDEEEIMEKFKCEDRNLSLF